jgi:hypothetical protein
MTRPAEPARFLANPRGFSNSEGFTGGNPRFETLK